MKPKHLSGVPEGKKCMKPVESLVRDSVRGLKPCVHGAEVLDAAQESGLAASEILDFSSSVNPLGASKKALLAAKSSFREIPAYPDSNCNSLRSAIIEHFGRGLSEDNVVVGNGSTELMYLFAETFLRKGDVAVIPAPTFGEYENAVRKAGEMPRFVNLGKGFTVDTKTFGRMTGAKILFLCNPNNPTSMLIPKDTLIDIVERALKQDTLVFLDEDFLEFVEGERELSLIGSIDRFPNLFVLRSFTKIFGLTGLRVGYGISSAKIVNALLCTKIPWNVNCIAQAAAIAALKDDKHLRVTRELVKKEKAWLSAQLACFGDFRVFVPAANFFFIDVRKSGLTAGEIKKAVLHEGVLIRDCTSFRGLDQYYIRVAVKTHSENERLIDALKKTVER